MKIRFRKKSVAEWTCIFIYSIPFLFFLLMGLLGLPSLIKYTIDIAWIYLLVCVIKHSSNNLSRDVQKLMAVIVVFFGICLVSFFVNFQSILYFLWGFRNNARVFVFFFACVFYIHPKTAQAVVRSMETVFWLNFIVVLVQHFLLGYEGDYLGGIFGVERGCNGYLDILLIIVSTKVILEMTNKRRSLFSSLTTIAAAMVIAVLAETKVYIIQLAIIVLLAIRITGLSIRKVWAMALIGAAIILGGQAIEQMFPSFADWFNLGKMWELVSADSGYTGHNDMNRMTALAVSMKYFLPSLWEKLFGLGLGNCDHAAFSFLITPFYQAYGRMNYSYFSTAFLILETGLIGLSLYMTFFIFVYFMARKKRKEKTGNIFYAQMAEIMAVMCFLIVIYNAALRTEAAFMIYFMLALPFLEKGCQHPPEKRLQ